MSEIAANCGPSAGGIGTRAHSSTALCSRCSAALARARPGTPDASKVRDFSAPSHPATRPGSSSAAPSRKTNRSDMLPACQKPPHRAKIQRKGRVVLVKLMGRDPGPASTPDNIAMPKDSLTITDNRTNKTYEIPITDGTIRGMDLRQIKVSDDDFGLMSYDPAFTNTASCRSAITFIDGGKGILRYRGYPIAELAEQATYLEVAYLLIRGELPTASELEAWSAEVANHTFVHENVKSFMSGFRYDAHPMGMFVGSVGALSTFYPEAKAVHDPEVRRSHMIRLIAKLPTLAAWSYRHRVGMP